MSYDVWNNEFSQRVFLQKYSKDGKETWTDCARRVTDAVIERKLPSSVKERIYKLISDRKFIPGGRYLYAAGRPYHQVNNCFLYRAEDSREGWADLMQKSTAALMTGGGIGVDYSSLREEGAVIKKTGGKSTGPLALMSMVNEAGRYIMQGGQRRSAIWAGLHWNHPDVHKFLELKNHSEELMKAKEKDLTFPLPMELTNISVIYDTSFWEAMRLGDAKARAVWLKNCEQAFRTAEPGMSFNYEKDNESLRNACCEVVSEDDSDKCNLGTLWMQAFNSLDEFEEAVELSTLFLLCGGLYSDVPTQKVAQVGWKNNRIGLGLGGMHEWLLQREAPYEVTTEMHRWLHAYKERSISAATSWSGYLNVNMPKGLRAIAPTGTIGILAETTTGIEPLFCAAYKRRIFKDSKWQYEYVIDGAVKRLATIGIPSAAIADSYSITFEERVKFQADVQDYVDMAISSTCNMPAWGTEDNNFTNVKEKADILLKYAHRLRGFTAYPDGCRAGQPLERVPLEEALKNEGKVFEEAERNCVGGVCGA